MPSQWNLLLMLVLPADALVGMSRSAFGVAPRRRMPAMVVGGDAAAQIAAIQQEIQVLELQKQIAAMQAKAAPVVAPPVVAPPVVAPPPVAPSVDTHMAEVQRQIEMLQAKAAPVAPPAAPSVDTQMAEVQRQIEMLQAKAAPVAPPAAPAVDAQMAEVQKQIEMLQAKAAPVAPPAPAVPAVDAQVSEVQRQIEMLQRQLAAPPVVEALPPAMPMPAAAAVQEAVASASADVAAASAGPLAMFGVPYLGVVVPLLAVPMVYYGGTALVSFVNERYDNLQGADGAESDTPGFAPPAPGNQAANRMWASRQAEMEVARANTWEAPTYVAQRNAREIFVEGLSNLASEPTGWFFGAPSALYSNVALVAPEQPTAAAAPAPARMSDEEYAARLDAIGKPPAASAPIMDAPLDAPSTGRVVPFGSQSVLRKSRRKARQQEAGTARVPPSTPEQVESARRGEYDYNPPAE